MVVVSAIITIVSIAVPGMQFAGLLGAQMAVNSVAGVSAIIGMITSAGSLALSITNMALNAQNENAIKEQTKQTTDLMLKNAPKSGNFVDTSITDPYAMYANGRLYKQGGAGGERYDQVKPYEPYRYLDDKFGDSDVYDILNNKSDKLAGGNDYFSNLYRDAKWTSPQSLKALLNGQIPFYLSMRTKIIETIFKWLTKEDLGTYYLQEAAWRDSIWTSKDDVIYRYDRIEFKDIDLVYGFTHLAVFYDKRKWEYVEKTRDDDVDDSGVPKTYYVWEYVDKYLLQRFSTATSWDKTNSDNKVEKKENNITKDSKIKFIKEETKILKGSDIKLEWVNYNLYEQRLFRIDSNEVFKQGYYYIYPNETTTIQVALQYEPYCVDSNLYFECTYKVYEYGGKEVIQYSKIYALKDYKEGDTDIVYVDDTNENKNLRLDLNQSRIYSPKQYIWEVRGEHDAEFKFRPYYSLGLAYARNMFIEEETTKHTIPYINNNEYFRYFDKKEKFGYSEIMGLFVYACAISNQKDYVKTTIYSKENKDAEYITYFGMSNFLSAKRNITFF